MRTDELIVELARAAAPTPALPRPLLRLAWWAAAVLPLMFVGVIVVGPRADVLAAMLDPAFLTVAAATLSTALLSAASALVLAVPAAERSWLHRVTPLVVGALWTMVLVVLLTSSGAAVERLRAFPFHWACVIQIVALSLIPGSMLFAMVRRAAPLRRAWAGALAILGGVAIGALATQFICPLDDPAHQLAGHVLPVAIFSLLGAIAGHRYLNWQSRAWR